MKLSILIATLESRKAQFERLCAFLEAQPCAAAVQILSVCDNGQMTIGAKRQMLLEHAAGDFIVYVDDDDEVAGDYIPSILAHCNDGIDCIGFPIDCYGYVRGKPGELERAIVSNRYNMWAENFDGFRYVRCPHHLVPVRREHALKAGFDAKSRHGEDHAYSMRLLKLGLLKNEAFIDRPMYTIRHNPFKKAGE